MTRHAASYLALVSAALAACSGRGGATPSAGAAAGSDGASGGGDGQVTETSGQGGSSGGAGIGASGTAGTSLGSGGAGAGAGGSSGTAGALSGTPREEVLPELTGVRQEHSVVALAGEIYIVGGYSPISTAVATVEAYNPSTRTWRGVQDFPQVLNHANAAVVGNKLYVLGFYIGSSQSNTSGQVYAYDASADEWTERTGMPEGTERASGCVAALGEKIYVFGGARGATVSDASVYDTLADSWQTLPALPEPREHCAAGAIAGVVYIAAGRADAITGFGTWTFAFDPVANTYAQKAQIPTLRGGVAGAVLADRLFVFGGEGNSAAGTNGVFGEVEAYDPASNSWQNFTPLQIPRHGYGAATLDGRIYLPGGANRQGGGAVNDASVYYFE
ncbi:MAG TPA: kelch repeat-containing protein [Polyangiaceae bacterium]|nr:kelch repeat-containing protein [Polyangiaceae bacterium]